MLTNLTSASLVVVSLSSSSSSSLPPYCLLRSTAASLLSPRPLPRPMPSPLRPLRRPLWRPPNQPHLVPFIPSLPRSHCLQRRATPPPPPALYPACPPTGPRNRSLPYHRATPRTDSPITRPPPILFLSRPPALATPSLCPPSSHRSIRFARLRSRVSSFFQLPSLCPLFLSPSLDSPLLSPSSLALSLCRSTPFPLFFPALPLPRDARCNPLRANQHTRKPRDARASE